MGWDNLRFFLAVAKAGSLSGAAKLLGASQPTVGRRIQYLEQEIGQKLFQRSSDGYYLTDEGLLMLGYAEKIENETLALARSLNGQEQELNGVIKVSSSEWFGIQVLSPIFSEFLEKHPQVCIELVTDSRPFNLNRREADLAFRIIPFEDPDIVQRKILNMTYAVYCSVEIQLDKYKQGEGLGLITMDTQFENMPDAVWMRQNFPESRVLFRSNNRMIQAQVCSRTKGIAVLPRLLGDHFQGLKRINYKETPPSRDVWVGYHMDLRNLSRLRSLITFTSEAFDQHIKFDSLS